KRGILYPREGNRAPVDNGGDVLNRCRRSVRNGSARFDQRITLASVRIVGNQLVGVFGLALHIDVVECIQVPCDGKVTCKVSFQRVVGNPARVRGPVQAVHIVLHGKIKIGTADDVGIGSSIVAWIISPEAEAIIVIIGVEVAYSGERRIVNILKKLKRGVVVGGYLQFVLDVLPVVEVQLYVAFVSHNQSGDNRGWEDSVCLKWLSCCGTVVLRVCVPSPYRYGLWSRGKVGMHSIGHSGRHDILW